MTKLNLREQRRIERAKRRNRQRLLIIGSIFLVVVAFGALIYYNATKDKVTPGEVMTTASGLKYQDITVGTGQEAKTGDTVSVHYSGYLTDGTKFDSSVDRGEPFQFTVGAGNVIAGWDEGLVGMRVGGVRQLTIPPDLGYGAAGAGGGTIPPNATLIFDVELISIP